MKVVLGSKNPDKVKIVKKALQELRLVVEVVGVEVESGITNQPLDKETTRKGAATRAINAKKKNPDADLWFGLEGGLHNYSEGYRLVTCAILIDKEGKEFSGEGEEIHLPVEVSDEIKNGGWFVDVVRRYAKEHEIDKNLITRSTPFTHAIQNMYAGYLKDALGYRKGTIGIITDSDSKFLVVQMVDYGENDWRFPGGGVEEGEKEEETILRELREELGTDKFEIIKRSKNIIQYDWPDHVIASQIKNKNRYFRGQRQTQFLIKFMGNKKYDIIVDPNELNQIKWIKKEELRNYLHFERQFEEAKKVLEEFGE